MFLVVINSLDIEPRFKGLDFGAGHTHGFIADSMCVFEGEALCSHCVSDMEQVLNLLECVFPQSCLFSSHAVNISRDDLIV